MASRPPIKPLPSGTGNSTSTEASQTRNKRRKLDLVFDASPYIYILPGKLEEGELTELQSTIEANGGRVTTKESADIVITRYFKPERLRIELTPARPSDFTVLHPDWVSDSVKAGTRLPYEQYLVIQKERAVSVDSMADEPVGMRPAKKRKKSAELLNPPPWDGTLKLACQRWTPLVCPNQGLVDQLSVLREFRRLSTRLKIDAGAFITYGRAIASIKAYPHKLTLPLPDLPYVGESQSALIEQYLRTGFIDSYNTALSDTRFMALRELASVYGIGPKTAQELYDGQHIHSIDELRQSTRGKDYKAALHYMDDLSLKIPRAEVEEIAELVNTYLQKEIPGAIYEIVGGYRRGKPQSNDIDIIFTRPDGRSMKDVLDRVVKRLIKAGLLVHLINTFGGDSRRPEGAHHHHASGMDRFDKIFGIWLSKADGKGRLRDIHRRVDLIAADFQYYYTAILGWTGSTQFERDLRRRANQYGYTFDSSGITHKKTGQPHFVDSEEAILELFHLEWIPPEWRNCD